MSILSNQLSPRKKQKRLEKIARRKATEEERVASRPKPIIELPKHQEDCTCCNTPRRREDRGRKMPTVFEWWWHPDRDQEALTLNGHFSKDGSIFTPEGKKLFQIVDHDGNLAAEG